MMAMPIAWTQGYEWAGSDSELGCDEAIGKLGYDLDSREAELFAAGAESRLNEDADSKINPDAWAEKYT